MSTDSETLTPIKIFFTYLKIGVLAFGGGYVMLPLLEREFSEKKQCIPVEELYELFALAQTIPGLIAVNMATFLGHRLQGVKGALAAASGVIIPSIVIITVIAAFLQGFDEIPWVQSIFHGLNIAIVALILELLWKMGRKNLTDWITLGIFLITVVVYFITGWNPVFFVIFGICAGLLLAGRGQKE